MSDFKPGDRVRWVADSKRHRGRFGATGTVVGNTDHSRYINVVPDISDKLACPVDGQWHALPHEIEKVKN